MTTATTGPEPAARAAGLGFRYGRHEALREIEFTLSGGTTGLVGVNGAGKSTLIRLLATTLTPTHGALELFGVDSTENVGRARRRIGYMPQALTIPSRLTVGDFLGYMAWLRGFSRRERRAFVDDAVDAADLRDRTSAKVGSLSGGMHRRLLFAQAILGEPDLLLLDEPTAGLDPEQRIRIRNLIAAIPAARATIVSSHLMEDLVPLADRVLMLDSGSVVFDGTVADLAELGAGLVSTSGGLSVHEAAFLSLCSRRDGR